MACSSAKAAPVTWEGDSAPTPGDAVSWTDLLNWSGDALPNPADDLTFGLGTAGAINLGGNQTAKSLLFNHSFTLGTVPTHILSVTSGNITVTGTTAAIAATLNTANLNLTGTGTLVLSNSGNTLTGTTSINTGSTLRATNATALGAGAVKLAGGTLDLNVTATTATNGLSGRVFTGQATSDTALINFSAPASSTRLDANLNATAIGSTTGVQWLGKLSIAAAGNYTFYSKSDDGSRLFIDGVLVLNNDGGKGVFDLNTAPLALSAGLHDIRIDYVNNSGGGSEELAYSGGAGLDVDATRTVIPSSKLFAAESSTAAGASNAVIVGSGLGNALNVTSSSTVNLNGTQFTQVQVGDLTLGAGNTLTVTGLAGKTLRAAGNVLLGAGSGISNTPDVALDGAVSDGGAAVTFTKTGAGRLIFDHTGTANSLLSTSNLDVQGGTLDLVGSSASGSFNPIGSAGLQLSGGNLVLESKVGGPTFDNSVNVTADARIQDLANAATTTLGSSAHGITIAPGTTLTLDAIAGGQLSSGAAGDPGATLNVAGPITGSGTSSIVLTSTILGSNTAVTRGGFIFSGNNSAFGGNLNVPGGVTLQARGPSALTNSNVTLAGAMSFLADGDGSGVPEGIVFNDDITMTGNSAITVGRLGSGSGSGPGLFQQAANKRIQLDTLSIGNQLNVTNNNGYGLEFTGTTTLTVTPTFSVANATPSNLTQGLTLSGQVTGGFGLIKLGAGTLVLANNTNNFAGTIDVQDGVLSVSNVAQLGTGAGAANIVQLTPGTGTAAFRATGDMTLDAGGHTIVFNSTAGTRAIDVSLGKTLTLNTPFGLGAVDVNASAALDKRDVGTVVLTADNSAWTGGLRLLSGVARVTNANALGSGSGQTTVSGTIGTVNAAIQLDGGASGMTIAKPFLFGTQSGIDTGGALQSLAGAGANTLTGLLTLNGTTFLGADGAAFNINGGVSASNISLGLTGSGNGFVNSVIGIGSGSLTKLGTGTWTLTGANTFTGAPIVNQGTLVLSGGGLVATGGAAWQISNGATLLLDNNFGHLDNRLGTKGIHFGGNLTIRGDSSAPTIENVTGSNVQAGSGGSVLTLSANVAQPLTLNITSATNSFRTAGAGSALYRGTGLGTTPGAGVATMLQSATTFVGTGQNGAAGSSNRGILPYALVDQTDTGFGTSFATYDSVKGITVLGAGDSAATITANANVITGAALPSPGGTTVINSLTLNSGGAVAIDGGATLQLDSGGLLAFNGNTGISGGGILSASSNRELIVHVVHPTTGSGASLTIGSSISGTTGGLVKADGGTLVLGAPNYYTGATTVNGGTLQLNGGDNTLFFNQPLTVNTGGTLDLNGTSQYVNSLRTLTSSNNETSRTGGTVTSSTGTGTLVVNSTANPGNFAGTISGANVSFARSGTNTLNLMQPLTYGGSTLINGGSNSFGAGTVLMDDGALTNTPSITINYSTLALDNGRGLADSTDRVNDAAVITLNGGAVNFFGRALAFSTETLGPVTLAQGTSTITSANGNNVSGAIHGATLTLSSLTRNAPAGATVNFGTNYVNTSAGSLGRLADSSGRAENIVVTGGLPLTNNIVGPWAVVTGYFVNNPLPEFASYNPTLGVGALNAEGFAGYDGSTLPASSQPAQNIRLPANGTVAPGGITLNALNIAAGAATTVDFSNPTDVLNLASGGLMVGGNFASNLGSTANPGRLTAGGTAAGPADLYVLNQQNNFTINSQIVDNPNGAPVRLVVWGNTFGPATVTLANNANNYTGGTVVNQETLAIGATGRLPGGAAGLTINGGSVTQTAGGTIASQAVTINGGGVLTLAGDNTLSGLTINNIGGTANPTVNAGGVLTLSGSNIATTSNNVGTTATVTGGTLDFGGATGTLNVGAITVNGQDVAPWQASLNIASVIRDTPTLSTALTKSGGGVGQLSGASTFTGGVNLDAGGLIIGASSTPSAVGSVVTSGPLGTGTLTIGADTSLLSSGAFTLANAISIEGDFAFNGTNNLTLNGAATLPNAANTTITVAAPQMTATFGGSVSGTGSSVTKQGLGTLVFSGTTTFDGGTIVAGGTVRATGANGPTANPLGSGPVTLSGGGLDLRNNGNGINGTIYVGGTTTTGYNDVVLDPGVTGATINVNNNGANTNNAFQLGTLTMAGGQTLTVTGGNSYSARFTGTNFTGTGPVNFNPAAGVAVGVIGTTTNGLLPVNTGAGTLLLGGNFDFTSDTAITTASLIGAVPVVNTTASPFGAGHTVTLGAGVTMPIVPAISGATLSSAGYTQGSLLSQYYSFPIAGPNAAGTSGAVAGATVIGQPLGDMVSKAAPPLLTTTAPTSPASSMGIYSGLLQIDTGGTYTFGGGSDDRLSISIDGTPVIQDIASGHGLDQQATKTINLSSGLHTIVIKTVNTGGGGGYYVLYGGPDTAGNGITGPAPGLQMIPNDKLFATANPAAAGNGFLNAGVVNNAFAVAPAATATLDGQGTDLNSALGSLTLGTGSTLNVSNQFGIGSIGVVGTTTLGATATISPGTGTLNLIAGINDGGNGLTKTGNGTLILGGSTAFTGPFAINAGYVQIGAPTALSSSALATANVVAAGAELDLNGIQGVTGNITLNGAGPVALANAVSVAALVNSRAEAASATGTISIGSAIEIQGLGDIALDGVVQDGPGGTISKVGPNTLTLNGNNTFTGVLTIGQGIVKLGHANALGSTTGNTILTAGTALDLNGQTSPEPLSVTGAGVTNLIGNSTLGAIFNTGAAATLSGPVTMLAATSIGGNSLAAGSATATPAAGDITLRGALGGAFAMTKVGANTLYLTNGANTATNFTVSLGTVRLHDGGAFTNGNSQNTINTGGSLVLDNAGMAVSERLGNRGLFINGNLTILGNPTTPVAETINTGTNNLNFANSGSVITLDASAGAAVSVMVASTSTSMFTRTAGATALIRGTDLGLGTGVGIFGTGTSTGGTQNNGQSVGQAGGFGNPNRLIMPWALVDSTVNGLGTSFATFGIANGITTLLPNETSSTLTANNNILLGSTETVAAANTLVINSLTLGESTGLGSAGGVIIPAGSSLQLDSGGLLAFSNNNGITGAGTLTATNTFNRELIVHTVGSGTALNISTPIYSIAGGLTKADGGTLLLSAQENYLGNTTVNGGTLKLNGGNQTIFEPFATAPTPGSTAAGISSQVLQVNLGGTFDLNGNNQSVINFNSAGTLPGTGGTVTNSSGTAATFRTGQQANQTFAGSMTGNLNFVREGNNTFTLNSPQTYTGSTTLTGGLTDLVDLGTLENTSGINIRRAVLRWNDTGIQALDNRINLAAGLTLDGGAFGFVGRTGTQATAAVGAVTLNSGANWIASSGTSGTATLTLASIARAANTGAAVTFVAGTNSRSGALADSQRILITAPPTLTNGIIGGWATVINGTDIGNNLASFATYDPAAGVRGLTGYNYTTAFAAGNNTRITGAAAVPTGGATTNSLTMSGGAAFNLTFGAETDTLTLQSGGLLVGLDAFSHSISTTADFGRLTAGPGQQELFLHNGSNTLTVNARIIDNGAPLSVVLDSLSQTGNTPTITLAGANTYSGTTYANGVVVNLNAATGSAIPGNLVISGANNNGADSLPLANATLQLLASNQIADAATVTLLGGSQLSLNGFDETIAALKLSSDGGSNGGQGPVVQTGPGTLTVGSGGISATNLTNAFNIATVNGFLNLPGAQVIDVDDSSLVPGQIGLEINAAITNSGGLTKTGAGVLGIGGKSLNLTGPVLVNQGTLAFGASTANIGSSTVTVAGGAVLDTRGLNGTIGALAGAGSVTNFNQTTGGILTTGYNDASTTFDGTFSNPFVRGLLSVTKVGTGTMNLTGDSGGSATSTSANLGTLTVNRGAVTLDSATGKVGFTTYTLTSGGTINLDNSTNNVANRLGGSFQLPSAAVLNTTTPRALNLQGGSINITGPGTGDLVEGFGTVALTNGASTLTINPGAGGTNIVTLNSIGNIANSGALGGTLLLRGAGLGGIAGSGMANVIMNTAPQLIGGGGVAGTRTMSIRPDIIGDTNSTGTGTGFVTYVAGTGFRLLDTATELLASPGSYNKLLPAITATGSTAVTVSSTSGLVIGQTVTGTGIPAGATIASIDVPNNTITLSAAATANGRVTATFGVVATSNVTSMTASTFNSTTTLNSLVLDSGGGITSTGGGQVGQNYSPTGTLNQLIVTSGGILAQPGNTGITGGQLTTNTTNQLIIHAVGDLDLGSYITAATGTQGVTKSGGGALSLNVPQYYTGTTTLNGGTLSLNSGEDNTIMVTPTNNVPTLVDLRVNAGTVDLNGQNQAIGALSNNNPLAGAGGTITSTTDADLISSSSASTTFSGSINGAISFTKAGSGTLTLTNAHAYTGPTTVMGGTLLVRDNGTLLGTSGITLNFGTLQLDDSGLANITPRTPVVPISMSGGGLTFNGDQSIDSATVGAVTALRGTNTITLSQLNNNFTGRFNLTINDLVRGPGAIVNFANSGANIGDAGGSPGVFLTRLNGAPFSEASLVNGLIGGWAIMNGSEFASYRDGQGLSRLGNTGAGYPGYGSTNISTATATQNVNDGTSRTLATSITANSWRIAPNAANTVTIGAAGAPQTLTLACGGLLTNNNNTFVIAQGDTTGFGSAITSGTSELDVFVNQNTTTIGVKIVNGTGPAATLSLVKSGGGTLRLSPGSDDTYSGATIVNQGTLSLNAAPGILVIPGDLTINNATVSHGTANASQIAITSNVTINGAGTLTMPNAQNFLNSLIFAGLGGTSAPTVATGTSSLTLAAQSAITSSNDNFATTPTISGGALAFGYEFGPTVITTSGTSPVDLRISAPITSVVGGLLVKTGPGSLSLDGNNLFGTGFQLADGTLIADNNAAVGTIAGTFTIGDASTAPTVPLTIMSGTVIRTLASPVTVNRDFTFGGTVAANGLILSGAVDLGAVTRTITVSSPLVTSTISGALTGAGGLIKAGPGILTLSNAGNSLGGPVTISGGILKNGAANAVPNASELIVGSGAAYDLNGQDQILQKISGSGLVTNSGSAKTLTIGGTSATDTTSNIDSSFAGVIGNAASALGLQKVGLGALTLQGSGSFYTGTTSLKSGTLAGLAANSFSPFSTINMGNSGLGAGATLPALALGGQDQTIGGLAYLVDSATPTVIDIAAGSTLTIGGSLSVGFNLGTVPITTTATSKLTFGGTGSLVVANPTAIVSVGIAQSTQLNTPTANTLDLRSLSSVTLGSAMTPISEVRVGFGMTAGGTLLLSNTANLITATNLSVGHSNNANGGVGFLTLGNGTNVVNADTINIGFSKVNGTVAFASPGAGSPGTLTIHNKAGTGGADINIGSQAGTATAAVLTGTLDLRGHTSNITANNVTVGNNNNIGGTGSASGVIFFDTGTFDAANLNLGLKSTTGTAAAGGTGTATVNLSGGDFTVSGTTTIANNFYSLASGGGVTGSLNVSDGSFSTGSINAAVKSGVGTGAAAANVNVSGGSLTVESGGAFTMATNTGSGSATALLNITDGTVTSNVDITKGGGTNTSATITLGGGSLDLTGHQIGSSTSSIATNFNSGTLSNVAEINGGAGFTKGAAGILTLDGDNSFTGPVNLNQGTLRVAASGTFASAHTLNVNNTAIAEINGTISGGSVRVAAGGSLQGTGTIAESTSIAGLLAPGPGAGTLTFADASLTLEVGATYQYDIGPGDATDRVTLTGASMLTFDGEWTLRLADLGVGDPNNREFVLFDGHLAVPPLNLASFGTPTIDFGNTGWSGGMVSYDAGGNNLVLTGVVPEPSSWSMLVSSLSLALSLQRFRRRRSAAPW
ncbi:MAG: hypothetical protein QOE70_2330 [Chthoniobacter sp.]|nr:hypothetical protein [Chthoniobacter sp.]